MGSKKRYRAEYIKILALTKTQVLVIMTYYIELKCRKAIDWFSNIKLCLKLIYLISSCQNVYNFIFEVLYLFTIIIGLEKLFVPLL